MKISLHNWSPLFKLFPPGSIIWDSIISGLDSSQTGPDASFRLSRLLLFLCRYLVLSTLAACGPMLCFGPFSLSLSVSFLSFLFLSILKIKHMLNGWHWHPSLEFTNTPTSTLFTCTHLRTNIPSIFYLKSLCTITCWRDQLLRKRSFCRTRILFFSEVNRFAIKSKIFRTFLQLSQISQQKRTTRSIFDTNDIFFLHLRTRWRFHVATNCKIDWNVTRNGEKCLFSEIYDPLNWDCVNHRRHFRDTLYMLMCMVRVDDGRFSVKHMYYTRVNYDWLTADFFDLSAIHQREISLSLSLSLIRTLGGTRKKG